jgi:hypothetical protein
MSEFVIKPMTKKELRNEYGITVDQWDTWMKQLRSKKGNDAISKTRALLSPREVKVITDQFGTP